MTHISLKKQLIVCFIFVLYSLSLSAQNKEGANYHWGFVRVIYKGGCALYENFEQKAFGLGDNVNAISEATRFYSYSILADTISETDDAASQRLISFGTKMKPLVALSSYPQFGTIQDKRYTENEKILSVYLIDSSRYILILHATHLFRKKNQKSH